MTYEERKLAKSMEVFAEGQAFKWGEWQAWHKACDEAGRVLPPAEFKKG